MKDAVLNRYLGMYILLAVIATTFLVTPYNSVDPINLPKLCLLIMVAFVAAGLVLSKRKFLFDKNFRVPLIISGAFILQLILVLLIDSNTFSFKFYGTPSRNTGFIAYLSLSFLLVASMSTAGYLLVKRYVWALVFSGAALALYGFAQSKGIDFYEFSNAYQSNVFGTFGNPNFQSAFMGIAGATALTLAIFSSLKLLHKVALVTFVALAVFNVSLSSQQGYLNFIAGFIAAVILYLFQKKHAILGWVVVGLVSIGILSLMLGILDKGPLAEAIYKSSLQARGFYWRGAINMIINHPFFGVGMDGFGDWYRRSRSIEVAQFNTGIVADTAHNVPLDIGSSGGVPLLILYLAIVGLALYSIIKVVKRRGEFDVYFAALVAAWVAYQAQSLISINQLGLGVWGWSLTGLLIGYEINTRDSAPIENQKVLRKGKPVAEKLSAGALVITFITGGIGLAIAVPPYLAANKFYKALQSGDANVIQPAAYLQPYDRSRFTYVAKILQENKLENRAITVLRDASKIYPDSYEIWNRWAGITSASPIDIARAKAEMKRLDPFNPDLK
jgi:O-antigen ligase